MLFTWRRPDRTIGPCFRPAARWTFVPATITTRGGSDGFRQTLRRSGGWRSSSPDGDRIIAGKDGRRGGAGARGEGSVAAMIPVPSGVRVWLAVGHTDNAARDEWPGAPGAGSDEGAILMPAICMCSEVAAAIS